MKRTLCESCLMAARKNPVRKMGLRHWLLVRYSVVPQHYDLELVRCSDCHGEILYADGGQAHFRALDPLEVLSLGEVDELP